MLGLFSNPHYKYPPLKLAYFCVTDLGNADDGAVFDPSKLDPDRCESCYGAETEDLK